MATTVQVVDVSRPSTTRAAPAVMPPSEGVDRAFSTLEPMCTAARSVRPSAQSMSLMISALPVVTTTGPAAWEAVRAASKSSSVSEMSDSMPEETKLSSST